MDEVTRERLWELLTGLIDTVEKAAPVVWDMAVRQAIVEGVISLVTSIVFLGFAIWCLRKIPVLFAKSEDMRANDRWSEHELPMFGAFAATGGVIVGLIVGLVELTDAIGPLVNPGYYAIKLLVELASGAPLP